MFFRAITAIHESLFSLKVAFVFCDLTIILVLLEILRSSGQGTHWVLAYAWHPLLATDVAGSGHIDIVGVLLLLVSAAALGRRWRAVAAVAFGPVSYTHLDVYKRQREKLHRDSQPKCDRRNRTPSPPERGGGNQQQQHADNIDVTAACNVGCQPVSYTHLDVYKRQIPGNASSTWHRPLRKVIPRSSSKPRIWLITAVRRITQRSRTRCCLLYTSRCV